MVEEEQSQIGSAMWCICGEPVYVTSREVGFEQTPIFLNFRGDEINECPKCKTKWTKPCDLEYSEPPPQADKYGNKKEQ